MAKKRRQEIREALVSILVAANTSAGARVYNARTIPWGSAELPLINIITGGEQVDMGSGGYNKAHRTRELDVQIVCVATCDPGGEILNALDAVCFEVEAALNGLRNLNNLVTCFELADTSAPEIIKETSVPFIFATLTYNAIYVEQ